MFRQRLNILFLRIRYALIMLFDKDFYNKMKTYTRLDKYVKIISILSKGDMCVDKIRVINDNFSRKLFACDVTYKTTNPEACFEFRRQCLSKPRYVSDKIEAKNMRELGASR